MLTHLETFSPDDRGKSLNLRELHLACYLLTYVQEQSMGFWPFSERRGCPRWKVAMNIIYGVDDDMTATSTVDISEEAVSLFVRKPYPVGTVVDLHLAVDGNERWIRVKGKVTRASGGVMALQFLNLGKRDIEDLGIYLRQLQQLGQSELVAVS